VAWVTPSIWKSTFQTPPLSEAVAVIGALPATVAPLSGLVRAPVGAVASIVSGQLSESMLLLPASSKAAAVIVYEPSLSVEVVADQWPLASALAPPSRLIPL
jgi:hypothetical protein